MVRTALALVALTASPFGPFVWPTSVDVLRDGSVLVVENGTGRVLRVDPKSGRQTTLLSNLTKAYAAAVAPDGRIYLSVNGRLRVFSHGKAAPVPGTGSDVGPIAVGAKGTLAWSTSTSALELDHGKVRVLATGLAGPHGVAVERHGSVLVSDTDHGRVLRVARNGAVTTFASIAQPRGIDVAPDGTVYVVEAVAKRIGVFAADGTPRGRIGPRFGDPYAVAVAGRSLWVVDTAVAGSVRRISR